MLSRSSQARTNISYARQKNKIVNLPGLHRSKWARQQSTSTHIHLFFGDKGQQTQKIATKIPTDPHVYAICDGHTTLLLILVLRQWMPAKVSEIIRCEHPSRYK